MVVQTVLCSELLRASGTIGGSGLKGSYRVIEACLLSFSATPVHRLCVVLQLRPIYVSAAIKVTTLGHGFGR